MASKDKELEAISSIINLLQPLDAIQRNRVLEYVLKRLEMATLSAPRVGLSVEEGEQAAPAPARFPMKDVRSLTAEKQPRSANEMAALVAYYVAELAPEDERSETVNVNVVKRYFKMAGFPLPRVLKNVLSNAFAAGYFDNVSRGEYRLNPVGYNLVVHNMPKSGAQTAGSSLGARRKPKKPIKPSAGKLK